ncbi:hypothetical protein L0F63_000178 [Massospora cicadina]|nr:hypothetical protein L0F63_000178 [Massospora cicadina]
MVSLQVLSQCSNPVQRRELRSLSVNERNRFIRAIQKLHQKGSPNTMSRYDRYAKIHIENQNFVHGTPQFLPWHRQFIRNMEIELQQIDPGVTLPYWDWTRDAAHPEASYIFTSSFMGGNGQGSRKCVSDGPFRNWQIISPFVSQRVISQLLRINDYSQFNDRLEVAHGSIHNNIGGNRGDMLPIPIFFLHHVFVDMLWWNWQRLHPNSASYNGQVNGQRASTNDIMRPFGIPVSSVLSTNTRSHCYTYPTYRLTPSRGSSRSLGSSADNQTIDGSSLISIPKPLSLSFITMSNLDEAKVRKIEEEFRVLSI